MAFQINTDRYAYSAAPEEVSDNYAAEFAKKLAADEAAQRAEADSVIEATFLKRTSDLEANAVTLEQKLNTESAVRLSDDELLARKITEETASRKSEVSCLERELGSETAARINNDNELSSEIQNEAGERALACNRLENLITEKADKTHTHQFTEIVSMLDGYVDFTLQDQLQAIWYTFGEYYDRKAEKTDVDELSNVVNSAINLATENSEKIGDIENVLDSIIALQNSLIGGDGV